MVVGTPKALVIDDSPRAKIHQIINNVFTATLLQPC
jgi:hypothetical protein